MESFLILTFVFISIGFTTLVSAFFAQFATKLVVGFKPHFRDALLANVLGVGAALVLDGGVATALRYFRTENAAIYYSVAGLASVLIYVAAYTKFMRERGVPATSVSYLGGGVIFLVVALLEGAVGLLFLLLNLAL